MAFAYSYSQRSWKRIPAVNTVGSLRKTKERREFKIMGTPESFFFNLPHGMQSWDGWNFPTYICHYSKLEDDSKLRDHFTLAIAVLLSRIVVINTGLSSFFCRTPLEKAFMRLVLVRSCHMTLQVPFPFNSQKLCPVAIVGLATFLGTFHFASKVRKRLPKREAIARNSII